MAQAVTNPGLRLAGLIADLGHKLQSGNLTEEQLALFLKKKNPFGIQQATGRLTVPDDLSFEERIARGRYDSWNSDFTEARFPVTAEQFGVYEWKLFHFGHRICSESAIRLMEEDGFEPAQIGHLLAFGEAYPEEQKKYPIGALGSVAKIDQSSGIAQLGFDGRRRRILLNSFHDDWEHDCRFLMVRKVPGCSVS